MPQPMQGLSFDTLWQPDVIIQGIFLIIIYLLVMKTGIRNFFKYSSSVPMKKIISFIGGIGMFYAAFGTPIDYMSDNLLFSAHMVQHVLEIMVMTPLIIYGIPDWLLRPLLQWKPSYLLLKYWSHPVIAAAIFNICFSGFHIPGVYNEALVNENFHLFEHAVFFVTSFFMWWPIMSPLAEIHQLRSGGKLIYLLFNFNLMMPITVLLILAQHEWYPFYLTVPRIFGIDPISDMQLGGIIMLFGMLIPYAITAIISYMTYNEKTWYA